MVFRATNPKGLPRNATERKRFAIRTSLVIQAYYDFNLSRREISHKYKLSIGTINGILYRYGKTIQKSYFSFIRKPYDCGYLDLTKYRAMRKSKY
jgi:hypothetical protein